MPILSASAPTTLPPSGAAAGDLAGTYPNPTIGAGKVVAADIAAGAAASNVGTVGGDLTGTLPNPTVAGTRVIAPQAIAPVGLTGAVAASRYVGATASGAPASGTFAVGDFALDQSGTVWVCITAGTPGTWMRAGARDWMRQQARAAGLLSWNWSLQIDTTGGTNGPVTQHTVASLVPAWAGETYTGAAIIVVAAGSGFNKIQAALYAQAGTPLAVSTDQKALFGGTGAIRIPFSAAYTPTTDGSLYVGLYFDATVVPTMRRNDGSASATTLFPTGVTPSVDAISGAAIAATVPAVASNSAWWVGLY